MRIAVGPPCRAQGRLAARGGRARAPGAPALARPAAPCSCCEPTRAATRCCSSGCDREDLGELWDVEACEVVGGLYGRLHVPAPPQLRTLTSYAEQWASELVDLPRDAPLPRRLVEQAAALGRDLSRDEASTGRMIHTDLHYANVLAGDREPWLAIDPKPLNGDPHYEIAPMLWNRWDELVGAPRSLRDGIRLRFHTLVDVAGLDEHRARDWVVVRMMVNALWSLEDRPDPDYLTQCIAIAKAVQD